MADPGFPIGGTLTSWEVPISDADDFWQKHAKMKELGPIEGVATSPGFANGKYS